MILNPLRSRLLASFTAFAAFAGTASAERSYVAWTQEYDTTSTVSQGGRAVTTDARGNVFATGYAVDGASGFSRIYTAKYDALDGHLVWQKFHAPNGDAPYSITASSPSPMAIVCDSQGNAIVTGSQNAGGIDVVTIKYAAADGAVLWTKIYDGTAGGQDEGVKVAVDSNDDVIMTAKSVGVSAQFDIVTIKYAKVGGVALWTDRYNATNRDDVPTGLAIDGSNNVVVVGDVLTGSGVHSFYIRKLNSAGAFQWSKTIDTGGSGGATAVALNTGGGVFATGLYTNASGHHGYFTVAYSAAGAFRWNSITNPTAGDFTGTASDIAIGPDGNPVVTGWLKDDQGSEHAYTIKHDDTNNGANLGDFYDLGLVDPANGSQPFGDTRGKKLIIDGSSNVVVLGESDGPGFDADLIVTKYSADLGTRLFFDSYNGTFDSTDLAFGIAADGSGGVAIVAEPTRKTSGGTGRGEFFVRKYNRFIAASGDQLPGTFKYSTGNAPAVADDGAIAASVKVLDGAKKLGAIFTQGVAGGTVLPAVQGGDAAGVTGGKYASFSDPIVSPDGHYAFAGKVTGVVASKASCVWTDLGGALHLALQQGTPVPGMAENLASVTSLSLRDSRLLALVKVAAPATSNVALVSIDSGNAGTVLLRTGQMVTVGALPQTTIKKLTVLSPAKASPGDGRWQSESSAVALATLADKRTVLYRVTTAGVSAPLLFTGGDAATAVAGAMWKTSGLPAVAGNGFNIVTLGTLAPLAGTVTTADDTAIVRSFNGAGFQLAAREGAHPNDATLSALSYAGFTDPMVNNNGEVLFLATLKGTGVTAANSKALLFGAFGGTYQKVARTGDKATDSTGAQGAAVWSGFVAHALHGNTNSSPVFIAKLAGAGVTAKNNLGIWGMDSTGAIRRILRTGDVLGAQTVKSFTLLKPVPAAFAAARSVNSTGAVAALVSFTDGKQALVRLGLP